MIEQHTCAFSGTRHFVYPCLPRKDIYVRGYAHTFVYLSVYANFSYACAQPSVSGFRVQFLCRKSWVRLPIGKRLNFSLINQEIRAKCVMGWNKSGARVVVGDSSVAYVGDGVGPFKPAKLGIKYNIHKSLG